MLKTRADGTTVDIDFETANQSDVTALAKRVILVDSSGTVIKSIRTRENLAGSAGSGSNGDTNRVYTLTTSATDIDIVEVLKDGVLLVEGVDYDKDNSAKTITMLGNTFDAQTISVFFMQ